MLRHFPVVPAIVAFFALIAVLAIWLRPKRRGPSAPPPPPVPTPPPDPFGPGTGPRLTQDLGQWTQNNAGHRNPD